MSGRRHTLLFLLAALVAGLVCATSAGATGRPPVRNILTVGASCGETLTTKIKLTGSLNCSASGATALTIGVGGALDLGGNTLTVADGQLGVLSSAAGASVSDGTIDGGVTSIRFSSAKGFVVNGVTLTNAQTGISVSNATGAKITGNTISAAASTAIQVTGSASTTITGNTTSNASSHVAINTVEDVKDTISGNTSTGDLKAIEVDYGVQTNVSKNTAASEVGNAIYMYYGASNTVTGNTVTAAGANGIYLYYENSTMVSSNTVSGALGASSASFEDYEGYNNTFNKNMSSGARYGFYLYGAGYGPVTVTGNTSDGANDFGFYLYEEYFEQYVASGPLTMISGNTAKNTTRGHTGSSGDGFYDYYSVRATWKGNTAADNAFNGFELYEPSGAAVIGNTATNNDQVGIYLSGNASFYAPATVTGNKATGNGNYGLDADYGQPGSGNSGSGNTPFDCLNIVCTSGTTGTT